MSFKLCHDLLSQHEIMDDLATIQINLDTYPDEELVDPEPDVLQYAPCEELREYLHQLRRQVATCQDDIQHRITQLAIRKKAKRSFEEDLRALQNVDRSAVSTEHVNSLGNKLELIRHDNTSTHKVLKGLLVSENEINSCDERLKTLTRQVAQAKIRVQMMQELTKSPPPHHQITLQEDAHREAMDKLIRNADTKRHENKNIAQQAHEIKQKLQKEDTEQARVRSQFQDLHQRLSHYQTQAEEAKKAAKAHRQAAALLVQELGLGRDVAARQLDKMQVLQGLGEISAQRGMEGEFSVQKLEQETEHLVNLDRTVAREYVKFLRKFDLKSDEYTNLRDEVSASKAQVHKLKDQLHAIKRKIESFGAETRRVAKKRARVSTPMETCAGNTLRLQEENKVLREQLEDLTNGLPLRTPLPASLPEKPTEAQGAEAMETETAGHTEKEVAQDPDTADEKNAPEGEVVAKAKSKSRSKQGKKGFQKKADAAPKKSAPKKRKRY